MNSFPAVSPKDISAVIVNHNAGDLLTDCICRALEQTGEIIVVDNASTDSSLETLSHHLGAADNMRILRESRNLGYAAGCNIGLAASTKPYVLFLNPDCLLNPDAMTQMRSVLESNDRIGMVGGKLLNPDGTEQRGGRRQVPTPWRSFVYAFGLNRFARRWPRLFANFNQNGNALPDEPVEVEAISGSFMLMKKKAIDDVGSWDEKYFLHCEDLDICMRFRLKGWKIFFVPGVSAVHYQGTCSASSYMFVEWHKHKSMNIFYKKFFRHQYPGFVMWLVVAGVWFRFAAVGALHGLRRMQKGLSL